MASKSAVIAFFETAPYIQYQKDQGEASSETGLRNCSSNEVF